MRKCVCAWKVLVRRAQQSRTWTTAAVMHHNRRVLTDALETWKTLVQNQALDAGVRAADAKQVRACNRSFIALNCRTHHDLPALSPSTPLTCTLSCAGRVTTAAFGAVKGVACAVWLESMGHCA